MLSDAFSLFKAFQTEADTMTPMTLMTHDDTTPVRRRAGDLGDRTTCASSWCAVK